MRGIALRVGIIAAIAIGAFAVRPFVSGSAGDLNVGDCFDPPTGSETIKDVQHHPCTEQHGAEVIFVGKMPDATTAPTTDVMDQWVHDNCDTAYLAYNGSDINTSADWQMGYYYPTTDGWSSGDRGMVCFATRVDGTRTQGSLKKSS